MTHIAHPASPAHTSSITFWRAIIGTIALLLAIASFLLFRGTMPVYVTGEIMFGTSSNMAIVFALTWLATSYVAYHAWVDQGLGYFAAIMIVASVILMI